MDYKTQKKMHRLYGKDWAEQRFTWHDALEGIVMLALIGAWIAINIIALAAFK